MIIGGITGPAIVCEFVADIGSPDEAGSYGEGQHGWVDTA
jgi:hypothetical protein